MDLESGIWCTGLGHKNERINAVIKKQIATIMHAGFCYSNIVLEEAAQAILSVTGLNDGEVVFLSSGSEAVEISRQITKTISGKKTTLVLHDAYLGSYSSLAERTENWHVFDWEQCKTCDKKDNCSVHCEKFRTLPDEISEFIFEPGSSSGFVRFPPKTMIQNLVDVVRKKNGVVVIDEITTGVGRTGKWFGFQHYDIQPDVIALGKGLGNGYPVSATVLTSAVAKELYKTNFNYLQSHQNDPLGAAIAKEVVRQMQDDNIVKEVAQKGKKFLDLLQSLVDDEVVLEVRGRGLLFAVDLASEEVGNEIYDELIRQGFIVCNRKSLFRIDPPLTITEAEFDASISAFKAIKDSIKRQNLK